MLMAYPTMATAKASPTTSENKVAAGARGGLSLEQEKMMNGLGFYHWHTETHPTVNICFFCKINGILWILRQSLCGNTTSGAWLETYKHLNFLQLCNVVVCVSPALPISFSFFYVNIFHINKEELTHWESLQPHRYCIHCGVQQSVLWLLLLWSVCEKGNNDSN